MGKNKADQRSPGNYILKHLSRLTELEVTESFENNTTYDYQLFTEFQECYDEDVKFLEKRHASKKVFYCIDPHLTFDIVKDWYSKYDLDYIFTTQKSSVQQFKDYGVDKVKWLPFAADDIHIFNRTMLKKHFDIGFVGTYKDTQHQKERFDTLMKLYNKYYVNPIHYVIPYDTRFVYGMSKVGWNKSLKNELNMRTFEVTAANTLLITDEQDSIYDIFKKEDIVTYKDENDMYEKIDYYLSHPEDAQLISDNGFETVTNENMYSHRVQKMLEVLE